MAQRKITAKQQEILDYIKEEILKVEEKTLKDTGMTLNIAFNYGGRDEIVNATKKIAENIEHATLVIVPGEGHGSYIEHSDKLYPLLYSFLNK